MKRLRLDRFVKVDLEIAKRRHEFWHRIYKSLAQRKKELDELNKARQGSHYWR